MSYREIARRLGRHHTTISREIKRNKPPHSTYWYYFIERDVELKRHTARCFRCQSHLPLVKYVEDKLRLDWPPEAISARLTLDYPNGGRMRVSHETIYRWVYLVAAEGVDIHNHLRRRHKKRRKQKRYGSGRRFIAGRVPIHQRPAIVADRDRFGDWEGDTLEGARGTGGLATHDERKSRYLIAAKLSDKKAATMNAQTIRAFTKLPRVMCRRWRLTTVASFHNSKNWRKRLG